MKIKFTFSLVFMLLTIMLKAQNKAYTVLGSVINHDYYFTNNHIPITVTILGNSTVYQTQTDSNGHFYFPEVENGIYNLIAMKNGVKASCILIVFNKPAVKNIFIEPAPNRAPLNILQYSAWHTFPITKRIVKNFYPIATSTLSVNIKTSEHPSIKMLMQEKNVSYFYGVRLSGINEERIIGKQQLY